MTTAESDSERSRPGARAADGGSKPKPAIQKLEKSKAQFPSGVEPRPEPRYFCFSVPVCLYFCSAVSPGTWVKERPLVPPLIDGHPMLKTITSGLHPPRPVVPYTTSKMPGLSRYGAPPPSPTPRLNSTKRPPQPKKKNAKIALWESAIITRY